ncbi:MAG: hypothetical protein K6E95_05535 [Lachnospiraceae bacterium]|nr:hypothetical protein [Lachnospiraceae bacterium]
MPLGTGQKDRFSSVITKRLKHLTILLISTLLCATVLGIFVSGTDHFDVRTCVFACAFILSFAFLLIYYIDVNKENILGTRSSRIVMTLIPSICLFLLHCGNELIISCVLIVLLTLFSACFNFTLSSLTLFMIYVYAMFFPEFTLIPTVGTILYIFALALFARSIFSIKNSLYSALIVSVFYLIVLIIECDFETENILTLDHLIVWIAGIVSLIGVRFIVMLINKNQMETAGLRFTVPEEFFSATDLEASGPYILSGDNELNIVDTDSEIDDHVMAEDYKKLEERLTRVYQENNELQERVAELSEKKSVLSIEDVCSEDFLYLVRLKLNNKKVYDHSMLLADAAAGAAEQIACDKNVAYALGIIHDSYKILGQNYLGILSSKYYVPDYLIRPLYHMSIKNIDFPIMRETGIVMMIHDMITMYDYVTSNNIRNGDYVFTWSDVVKKTFYLRNKQNFLRYSGFTADEVNILKNYLITVGGDYYQFND